MPNSRCVSTEYKAIWKENLAIYQKSLGAFSRQPFLEGESSNLSEVTWGFFQATLFELSPSLLVGDMVNIGLIEGDRYAAQNVFLMFLLVLFFSLHHAQTTIDFKMCFETINRNVCAIACDGKTNKDCARLW